MDVVIEVFFEHGEEAGAWGVAVAVGLAVLAHEARGVEGGRREEGEGAGHTGIIGAIEAELKGVFGKKKTPDCGSEVLNGCRRGVEPRSEGLAWTAALRKGRRMNSSVLTRSVNP